METSAPPEDPIQDVITDLTENDNTIAQKNANPHSFLAFWLGYLLALRRLVHYKSDKTRDSLGNLSERSFRYQIDHPYRRNQVLQANDK